MKHFVTIVFSIIILWQATNAGTGVTIIKMSGDVRIRIGMHEKWHTAKVGMVLKNLDTILSGENSFVILLNRDDVEFRLNANSILDIADLRKIQDRELFLFLMNQKVDQIESINGKTKIRVGNVSVVHGDSKKETSPDKPDQEYVDWYQFELNGADALYEQQYYPNTIIKLHNIKNKYAEKRDQGYTWFGIGRAFEAMKNPGQALDSYQQALSVFQKYNPQGSSDPGWIKNTRAAVRRIREKQQ